MGLTTGAYNKRTNLIIEFSTIGKQGKEPHENKI